MNKWKSPAFSSCTPKVPCLEAVLALSRLVSLRGSFCMWLPWCSPQQEMNWQVWKAADHGTESTCCFLPAHLPPAEGEQPAELPRWESLNPAAPTAQSMAPGLRHLLLSVPMPSVSGIARRWHLPGEVGNASWIRSASSSAPGAFKNKMNYNSVTREAWLFFENLC